MQNRIVSIILIITLILALSGCAIDWRYDKEWMLGKTSEQIQARYGEFDGHPIKLPEDGLYKNCRCCYYLKVGERGLFGDLEPNEYMYVEFDENGIAQDVYTFTDPGG